ncbi:hypothetical protein ACS0TY_016084 [Phlomoides rotata]
MKKFSLVPPSTSDLDKDTFVTRRPMSPNFVQPTDLCVTDPSGFVHLDNMAGHTSFLSDEASSAALVDSAGVKAASDAVVHAEAAYLADPSSVHLMDLNQRRVEYILRTCMEEDFWRQKSTVRWVMEGERNTRFFQSLVKQKRVRTRIHSIHADGRTISDENELRSSASSFFQHHLSNDMIFDVIHHLHALVHMGMLLPIHWHGCTPSVDFMSVGTTSVLRPVRTIIVRWLLPPDPWIKLNTDGSYDQHTGVASGGGLFRDHLGALLLAFHTPLVVTSSFDAELQSLLHGLHLARRFDVPVWIKLDSLVVIRLLQTDRPGPWQGNRPADYMARRGSTSSALHLLTTQTVPRFFMTLVRMDQIGYPSFRVR